MPAYNDYTAKARMAQAVAVGHEATAAVERYFYANGRGPATLEQAGYAMDDPSHAVQDITVDAGNGMVRVFPSDLNYRGKAIAFTPRVDENKRVVWQCASDEIPARVLPPECHQDQGPLLTSPLEIAANAVMTVSIVLSGRNNVHSWWLGIVGCGCLPRCSTASTCTPTWRCNCSSSSPA
jgi:hypothetical protein